MIPKIFILTVKDTERQKYAKNKYRDNENITIIEFESGDKLNLQELKSKNIIDEKCVQTCKLYNYNENKFYYGSLGCAYAHRYAWEKILNDNLHGAIIVEDNIDLVNNYENELEVLFEKLNNLQIKYDMVTLHSFMKNKNRDIIVKNFIDENNLYKGNSESHGTKMYYITNKCAKILFVCNTPISSVSDGITKYPSDINFSRYYNFETALYYEFKCIKQLQNFRSVRGSLDGVCDDGKEKIIKNDNKKNEINYIKFTLNDTSSILYKLNKSKSCNVIREHIQSILPNKIELSHINYNLYDKNKKVKKYLMVKNKKDLIEDTNMNWCKKLEQEDLLKRLEIDKGSNNYISFTLKNTLNKNIDKSIDIGDNPINEIQYGKLYICFQYNDPKIICCFDNNTKWNDDTYEIGDLITDVSKELFLEKYSSCILKDIELLNDI
jgi:GR25 family glycosyltransferase involved in LPS biosynthesis